MRYRLTFRHYRDAMVSSIKGCSARQAIGPMRCRRRRLFHSLSSRAPIGLKSQLLESSYLGQVGTTTVIHAAGSIEGAPRARQVLGDRQVSVSYRGIGRFQVRRHEAASGRDAMTHQLAQHLVARHRKICIQHHPKRLKVSFAVWWIGARGRRTRPPPDAARWCPRRRYLVPHTPPHLYLPCAAPTPRTSTQ